MKVRGRQERENYYEAHRRIYLETVEGAVLAHQKSQMLDGEVLEDVEKEIAQEVKDKYPDLEVRRVEGLSFVVYEKERGAEGQDYY